MADAVFTVVPTRRCSWQLKTWSRPAQGGDVGGAAGSQRVGHRDVSQRSRCPCWSPRSRTAPCRRQRIAGSRRPCSRLPIDGLTAGSDWPGCRPCQHILLQIQRVAVTDRRRRGRQHRQSGVTGEGVGRVHQLLSRLVVGRCRSRATRACRSRERDPDVCVAPGARAGPITRMAVGCADRRRRPAHRVTGDDARRPAIGCRPRIVAQGRERSRRVVDGGTGRGGHARDRVGAVDVGAAPVTDLGGSTSIVSVNGVRDRVLRVDGQIPRRASRRRTTARSPRPTCPSVVAPLLGTVTLAVACRAAAGRLSPGRRSAPCWSARCPAATELFAADLRLVGDRLRGVRRHVGEGVGQHLLAGTVRRDVGVGRSRTRRRTSYRWAGCR